jgi:hypothetical protein
MIKPLNYNSKQGIIETYLKAYPFEIDLMDIKYHS